MDIGRILAAVDHTLLNQTASMNEVLLLCDDAIFYKTASVCIPPFYVEAAKNHCLDKMAVCTVIGFPNGYQTTAVKAFETADALRNGADEIDMVITIGALKDKKYDFILDEIKQIKSICGEKVLKVIIETSLLTDEEKVRMCYMITEAKADFIKTSTGFSTGGATIEDILLFKKHIGPTVKIKAAGGIKSLEAANEFLDLGVSRLGSSSIIKLVRQKQEIIFDL